MKNLILSILSLFLINQAICESNINSESALPIIICYAVTFDNCAGENDGGWETIFYCYGSSTMELVTEDELSEMILNGDTQFVGTIELAEDFNSVCMPSSGKHVAVNKGTYINVKGKKIALKPGKYPLKKNTISVPLAN